MDKRNRELGYNVINKLDSTNPNYVGHHINKIDVLFIPAEIHKSIYHSVTKNINMDRINTIAINWYLEHIKCFNKKL